MDICQILQYDLIGRHLELQLAGEAVPKFITDLSLSVDSVPSPVRRFYCCVLCCNSKIDRTTTELGLD